MDLKIPGRADLPAELTNVSPIPTIGALCFHWSVIAGAIIFAKALPGLPSYLLALVLIGTRQHALFLVVHEGTHFLISKNRTWNDRLSDWLAGWPVGVSTNLYRTRHWLHHRYLNTAKDPDWARKLGLREWTFPTTASAFWRINLPYLFGRGALEMFYAVRAFGVSKKDLPLAMPYYLLIAATITYFGGWQTFAFYWLLPYFTTNPVLHRFRYTTEHMALPRTHQLNNTRNVRCSFIENFFISPMNASMHLIHHNYPYIPWYRLKQAHEFLHKDSNFHEHAYELDAYFPTSQKNVYRELTAGNISSEIKVEKKVA